MKFVLKTVDQKSEKQPENQETTQYVRKNWSIFVAYYVVTSLAVGFVIAAALFPFLTLDHSKQGKHKPIPVHDALLYSLVSMGVVSAVAFLIQLISGPFVFTKDVVCRKCHRRMKVSRIAFFTGRYRRPPKCECGGNIEPAFLWEPNVSRLSSIVE